MEQSEQNLLLQLIETHTKAQVDILMCLPEGDRIKYLMEIGALARYMLEVAVRPEILDIVKFMITSK